MSEATAEVSVETNAPERVPLSRREFLNYLWAMSMAVAMAGSGGLAVWFLVPRFREGEFGGVFVVPVGELPAPDTPPKEFSQGRFWLSNIGEGIMGDDRRPDDYPMQPGVRAIYKVCTHLGCLYKWVDSNDRFECPCHGSKFLPTGTRIDGPARRNLDVFPIEVVDASGNVLTRTEPAMNNNEGTPVEIPSGAVELRIDTGRRITGAPNSAPGGGL
jgi:cytochrome b6-f complex iron-sulfur subunit